MFDLEFWLTFVAAVPAGYGGALLGARVVDWLRGDPRPAAATPRD